MSNIEDEVKISLWRRGYLVMESSPIERVIFPKEDIFFEDYYQKLFHYRFRRLLSDILQIKSEEKIDLNLLLTRWKWEEIEEFWNFLLKCDIISCKDGIYFFNYPFVDNFGETLEWFIAELLKREFLIPVMWGIKLKEVKGGGDFDILGLLEGKFMYIECKTSPPNNVRLRDLWEFLRRREVLKPKVTIFFIDTTLKVERNIIDNISSLFSRRFSFKEELKVEKLKEGIYSLNNSLYIMQSKGDLVRNFQIIFRNFLDGSD